MVWHTLGSDGEHIVTLTNGSLTARPNPAGPESTTTATAFAVPPGLPSDLPKEPDGLDVPGALELLGAPPPPHPTRASAQPALISKARQAVAVVGAIFMIFAEYLL